MSLNLIINHSEFERIQHIICPTHALNQCWWLYTILCLAQIWTSPVINLHMFRQSQSLCTRKIH